VIWYIQNGGPLGVYIFLGDLGSVFGAIGIGFIADSSTNSVAIQLVACIAIASGVFVLLVMKETECQYALLRCNKNSLYYLM
jgi:hypothetical protein